MRNSILELLRASGLEPVSGEKISEQLGVSRTAIWKHIQALKDEGYQIESVQKRGYILREAPNRLYPQEISSHLKTKWLGHSVCYEDLLPSAITSKPFSQPALAMDLATLLVEGSKSS